MEQKYLPIGSVCTLKGKNKKVMITGYYSVEFNGNLRIKDYCGYVYPEGMLLPEQSCIFNHKDIEFVDFVGFKNNEFEIFRNHLYRLTNNDINLEEQAAQFHQENDMFLASSNTYSKLLFDENGVVMIADKVIENSNKNFKNIKFSADGTVISIERTKQIKNPFYKDFSIDSKKNKGITLENSKNIFNELKFDENGVVISDNVSKIEESVPPVGPGLPGYVEPQNIKTSKYKFDENGNVLTEESYEFDVNGNLVALDNYEKEEEVPPIGPGLPGYVEPQNIKTSKYKFDENGNVLAEESYEFDVNGNLVTLNNYEKEEEVPPIGPGLPGYVEPQKIDNEFLDYTSEINDFSDFDFSESN